VKDFVGIVKRLQAKVMLANSLFLCAERSGNCDKWRFGGVDVPKLLKKNLAAVRQRGGKGKYDRIIEQNRKKI
jgi:hypothetical protein